MGHLHIPQPKKKKNHQPLQTHRHQDNFQKPKHNTTNQDPIPWNDNRPQQKRHLQTTTQNLQQSVHRPNRPYLSIRYSKHIRYIKNNDPQSAYAQHILQNIHEHGTLTDNMSLLKHIHNPTKLIPYEQLFIQTFHHYGNLFKRTIRLWTQPIVPADLCYPFNATYHTTTYPLLPPAGQS
jgi:hypothetical protein